MFVAFLDFLVTVPVIGKIIGLFHKTPPKDSPLGRVRAATEAVQKVDPSAQAIARDPDNLDRR